MKKLRTACPQFVPICPVACPDLPGCVAGGATQPEVEQRMREALRLHLDNMRKDGQTIPQPTSVAVYIEA